MRIVGVVFLLLAAMSIARAQGFQWTPSVRLPFEHPRLYVGIEGGAAFEYHWGELRNMEGWTLCGVYRSAYGQRWSVGAGAEYWVRPDRTIGGIFRWVRRQIRFTHRTDPVPQKDSLGNTLPPLVTEYEFVPIVQQLQIGARVKQRLLMPYAFVTAEVMTSVLLSYEATQTERIVSPPERRFADGSFERTVAATPVAQLATLNVGAAIGVGADIPLIYGVYASPSVRLAMPFFPIERQSLWRALSVSATIAVYVGL